jgi:flavorubredoxin
VHEAVFDDQLSDLEMKFFEEETLRYYANIVSTFSPFVQRAIKKLEGLEIKMIAPSHGIIWRKNPSRIVEDYARLASYTNGPAAEEITLIWSSMYGNTEALVDSIKAGVEAEGVKLHVHRVPQDHVSFVLASAWKSSGIIVGMPTYEYKMFPPMYAVLDILERSHVMKRKAFRFGSYGWSGGAQKQFDEFTDAMKWECLGAVEFQGTPKKADHEKAYESAKELARQVKAWKAEQLNDKS